MKVEVKDVPREEMQVEINNFYKKFKTVIISSKNENSEPYSSYAPFVKKDNDFYILVSETAPHYDYIMNYNEASLMMIDDESKVENIFFRQRVSFFTKIKQLENLESIENIFIDKFGEMAKMVLKLDFHILKCEAVYGKAILGPGKAFYLDNEGKIIKQDNGKTGGHAHRK